MSSSKRSQFFHLFPLFLIIYEFCTNMSNDMYLPALPLIASEFLTQINWVQLTITAWLAGNTIVQLIVGPLSDRYGRRFVLLGGGVIFLISTLACALAPSLLFLIGARVLQGVGVCTMMVAGYASIHDLYEDEKAIHILVWMGTAAVIAPAIGPVLGGLLLLVTDWRAVFFSLFFLGAISLLALWFIMPESTSSHKRQSLKIKTIISTYRKIISNAHFLVSAASFSLLYGGIMGWITTSPFILMSTLGLSPAEFGYMQIPVFGGYIVGAQLVKPLMKRLNKERLIGLGLTVSLLGAAALFFCSLVFPSHLLSFILPMAAYSIGFGFAAAPLNRITIMATQEAKGSAMAVFYLTMMGTGSLISLVLSVSSQTVLYSCLIIAVSSALSLVLNIFRRGLEIRGVF